MAWRMSGQILEACSCKLLCPCFFGPAEPDKGWCAGFLGVAIQQGDSDGVDLSGTRAALALDLPGDFVGGNATARVYLDQAANAEQRRELEAIFTGKKGGVWEPIAAGLVIKWLPTQTVPIQIQTGDNASASVGAVGTVQLAAVKDEAGKSASVQHAPAMGAFGVESADLARSDGTAWTDPEMRRWQGGGSGTLWQFSWSA